MTTVFQAGEEIEIVNIQKDCECFHCGRPLKVGIVLSGFGGAFGAQCLAKSFNKQTVKIGGVNYSQKLSSDAIKQRGIAAMRGENNVYGWKPNSAVFKAVLKTDLRARA
jgi:hypothetical protein